MQEGWIKIHRKMLDSPVVMKDADHVAIWMYILLNATHAECPTVVKGEKIILKPGQLITGSIVIGTKLKIDESKVRRVLNNFKNDGQIDRQTSNKNSLITVLNWDLYQNSDGQNDIQVTDKRRTSDGQVTTNKNVKNIKNDKNVKKYSDCAELNQTILDFMDFRKKINSPMTDHSVCLLLKELNKLSGDTDTQIAILNQSMLHGWKGIFPLKKDSRESKWIPKEQCDYAFDELEKELLSN